METSVYRREQHQRAASEYANSFWCWAAGGVIMLLLGLGWWSMIAWAPAALCIFYFLAHARRA